MALFRDQNCISTENSLRKRRRYVFMKEYLDDSWCILLINYPKISGSFQSSKPSGNDLHCHKALSLTRRRSDTGFNTRRGFFGFLKWNCKLRPPTGAWKVTDTRTEPTEFDITVFLSTIRLRTWQTLDEENRRSNRVPIFFFWEKQDRTVFLPC